MNILNEKQFNIALTLLNSSTGRSINAAKRHLVDGIAPVTAAKEFGISRQAVNNAINRVKNSYFKALEIQNSFDCNMTAEKKFDTAMLLLKNASAGRGLQAARLVLVDGLTNKEASIQFGISSPVLHNSILRVIGYYDKALAINNALSDD